MPNIKSAEKRVRQTKARTLRNRSVKTRVKTFRKKVQTAVEEGTKDEAEEQLKLFFKSVDKAAKQNVIHKNAAARYKSAMSKLVGAKS
ncbi:MAG: 30S ribosomal protein S20 [Verrucomicrobiota bacterium]